VPRKPSTHARLNDGKLELDVPDRNHFIAMMRERFGKRLSDESGFTLIELLVVIVIVGILAGIALAVFLSHQDKGRDASAKSDVTNLVRQVQSCNAGKNEAEDFRDCDTQAALGTTGVQLSSDPPIDIPSGDCGTSGGPDDPATNPGITVTPPGTVRVLSAGPDCFVVFGISDSGNRFWYVKHNGGAFSRDCTTRGVNGCPTDGQWAD